MMLCNQSNLQISAMSILCRGRLTNHCSGDQEWVPGPSGGPGESASRLLMSTGGLILRSWLRRSWFWGSILLVLLAKKPGQRWIHAWFYCILPGLP